ncbi:LLM class F420-dependent oxidoreductase, partial [Streptomyces sp. NPDC005534]
DIVSEHVTPEQVARTVNVSSDLGQHTAWLQEYADLGFDTVMLHHVGREQGPFIDTFGAEVLPRLDVTRPFPATAKEYRCV